MMYIILDMGRILDVCGLFFLMYIRRFLYGTNAYTALWFLPYDVGHYTYGANTVCGVVCSKILLVCGFLLSMMYIIVDMGRILYVYGFFFLMYVVVYIYMGRMLILLCGFFLLM